MSSAVPNLPSRQSSRLPRSRGTLRRDGRVARRATRPPLPSRRLPPCPSPHAATSFIPETLFVGRLAAPRFAFLNFLVDSTGCGDWHASRIDVKASRPLPGKSLRQGRPPRELRHARHMAPARPMPILRRERPGRGRIAPLNHNGRTMGNFRGGDHANAPHRALRPESLRPLARAGEPGQVRPPASTRALRKLAAPPARRARRSPPRRAGTGDALRCRTPSHPGQRMRQASSAHTFAARTARCQAATARVTSLSGSSREKRCCNCHCRCSVSISGQKPTASPAR
ncbi:Uncharacterised protein [Pandoraea pulmonicola]|uniref:Uncharacterized protein n=1 Tax=Pandoraea pulmonicola TaxID=93221 RepID=A0AAJ4ZGE8_PANPU|nr:Uncharacterised protein [Pandoraea pulmonicola]